MKTTQNQRVMKYMKDNGSITQIDALNKCGCMRLASRISDLKKEGYPIKRKMITVINQFGETCSVAQYSLEAEDGRG